jgi:hypothetical protein
VDNRKRLSDPAFEPTDEDLVGLSRRAFAHVREEQETAEGPEALTSGIGAIAWPTRSDNVGTTSQIDGW